MSVHLYTNGAWTDSGKIYRNSLNLFDISTITDGYRIQWGNGEPYPDPTAKISDYIEITPGNYSTDIIVCLSAYNQNMEYQGVYNGNGNFIKNLPSDYYNVFTIPSGIKYVRLFTFSTIYNNLSETTMFNEGSSLPFEPYNVVDWYTNTGHGYTSGAWS